MATIIINSESSLVRRLPYTSHLSSLLESGSTLIVWKWSCINDVNPWKISSGYGGAEERGGAATEKRKDGAQTDRTAPWWTGRQPQGLTVSLHQRPHVSISHVFSAFCSSRLVNTPSPVSVTGSNNSLDSIYLAKVPKSHVVARCENAHGPEEAVVFLWKCEKCRVAFSNRDAKWCPPYCIKAFFRSLDHHLFQTCFSFAQFYTNSFTLTCLCLFCMCDICKCLLWCTDLLNETIAATESDTVLWLSQMNCAATVHNGCFIMPLYLCSFVLMDYSQTELGEGVREEYLVMDGLLPAHMV